MKLGVTMMPVVTKIVQPSGYETLCDHDACGGDDTVQHSAYETWCDHDACGDDDSAAQWL
jgi:hypothetical protein